MTLHSEVGNIVQLASLVVLAALGILLGFLADGDAVVLIDHNLITEVLLLLQWQLSFPFRNAFWALGS